MSNEAITTALMQPFPPEAIKTRQGGGNTRLRYVEGHTIIHRLIDATGNTFDLRVLNLEQKGDLLTALVELTIPGLGSRQHIGVQKVSERGGEDLTKGAITDALKKAATLFGVGLELYGADYAEAARDTDARPAVQQRPAGRAQGAAPAPVSDLPQLTDAEWDATIERAWAVRTIGEPYEEAFAVVRAARARMTDAQYERTKVEVKALKVWTPEGEAAEPVDGARQV